MERLRTHQINVGLHRTPSKTSTTKRKMIIKIKMLVNILILLIVYIVAHCNLGINEMTSLSSYKDCWLLDTGATSHMTFRKDCFEELNETINGIVYFADRVKS